jgi:hypothetical protein
VSLLIQKSSAKIMPLPIHKSVLLPIQKSAAKSFAVPILKSTAKLHR